MCSIVNLKLIEMTIDFNLILIEIDDTDDCEGESAQKKSSRRRN